MRATAAGHGAATADNALLITAGVIVEVRVASPLLFSSVEQRFVSSHWLKE
jgi:hypothetical protein